MSNDFCLKMSKLSRYIEKKNTEMIFEKFVNLSRNFQPKKDYEH